MTQGIYRFSDLRQSDISAISRVHRRACLTAYAFMGWSYSEAEVRTWYAGKFPDWDWGQVALLGRTAIGFVAVAGTHLDQLFVDPSHQRKGVGSALLSLALARGPGVTTLNVFAGNAVARSLYERHGFHEVGRFFNEEDKAVELVYGRPSQPG